MRQRDSSHSLKIVDIVNGQSPIQEHQINWKHSGTISLFARFSNATPRRKKTYINTLSLYNEIF